MWLAGVSFVCVSLVCVVVVLPSFSLEFTAIFLCLSLRKLCRRTNRKLGGTDRDLGVRYVSVWSVICSVFLLLCKLPQGMRHDFPQHLMLSVGTTSDLSRSTQFKVLFRPLCTSLKPKVYFRIHVSFCRSPKLPDRAVKHETLRARATSCRLEFVLFVGCDRGLVLASATSSGTRRESMPNVDGSFSRLVGMLVNTAEASLARFFWESVEARSMHRTTVGSC